MRAAAARHVLVSRYRADRLASPSCSDGREFPLLRRYPAGNGTAGVPARRDADQFAAIIQWSIANGYTPRTQPTWVPQIESTMRCDQIA